MAAKNNVQACLVVLCGLPASGKSFVGKRLCETLHIEADHCNGYKTVGVVINYDDLLPSDIEKSLIEADNDESKWKNYRRDIRRCVRRSLGSILNQYPLEDVIINADVFKKYNDQVQQYTHSDKSHMADIFVFIIDDNMYYESMRYEYYQLAKYFNIGYVVVYVKCTEEICMERNAHRKPGETVLEHVIEQMARHFEEPSLKRNHWEKNLVVIDGITESKDALNRKLQELQQVITYAVKNPAHDTEAETAQLQEESRKICMESLKHQLDQILRKLVAETMISITKDKTAVEKRRIAQGLSVVKPQILTDFDKGLVNLDEFTVNKELVFDAVKNYKSELFMKIERIFKDYCAKSIHR